jgi:hypothetical protein
VRTVRAVYILAVVFGAASITYQVTSSSPSTFDWFGLARKFTFMVFFGYMLWALRGKQEIK